MSDTKPSPLVLPKNVFVGRREILDALLAQLEDEPGVADTFGVSGIGKSRLLEHLAREGRVAVENGIFLRHSAIELGGALQADGERPREPRLPVALQRFTGFLERARDEVIAQAASGGRATGQFKDFTKAAENAKPELTTVSVTIEQEIKNSTFGDNADVQEVSITEELFSKEVEERREKLVKPFVMGMKSAALVHPLLWAIDDFECIADSRMGDWLVDLVGRIDRCLFVLARSPAAQQPSPTRPVQPFALKPLSRRDAQDFLEQCLPEIELAEAVPELVHKFTDGHAGTLGLVAELLQRDPELARDAERLEAHFRALPEDLDMRQTELVRAIVPESELRTLQACAVVRRFDADLLAMLLHEKVAVAESIIERLRRHTFIEGERDADTGTTTYRLHRFIGGAIERQLTSKRRAELHGLAASFYFRWLADFDEKEAKSGSQYGGWYRYEDRRWQRHTREWLYHQALADASTSGATASRRSRMRFARVFLDAFWWWGCYTDFPFCRSLIEDWEASQGDTGWVKDLRGILNNYPTGWHKDGPDAGAWHTVRRSLGKVQAACGLDGTAESLLGGTVMREDREDARHTRALIDLFLAHASRYRSDGDEAARARRYEEAVAYYDEALKLFEADDDHWDHAWTLFERADLAGEHGVQGAAGDWEIAKEAVRTNRINEEDEELVANLHRMKADMDRRGGNEAACFAAISRALTHAYLFQNRPHPPDTYTLAFYQEMRERTKTLLEDVWPRPDREAAIEPLLASPLIAGRHDRQAIEDARRAAVPGPLLELLPRGPQDGELGLEESAFLEEWTDVCMSSAAARDDLAAG
jgi:hypothetical protein